MIRNTSDQIYFNYLIPNEQVNLPSWLPFSSSAIYGVVSRVKRVRLTFMQRQDHVLSSSV
jgi:hypothetical protein